MTHIFNQRANGIFMDGYVDRDGLPVGDVFAYLLRASIFGHVGKDWPKEKLASLIRCYSSDQLARLADDSAVAAWADALEIPPGDTSVRRFMAEALLAPNLLPNQAVSTCWETERASGFMVRRQGDIAFTIAEEWRDGDTVDTRVFSKDDAVDLAFGWVALRRAAHLDWRFKEDDALMMEFSASAPAHRAPDHAVITGADVDNIDFLDDLTDAIRSRAINRLTVVAGAETGWALRDPKRDVIFLDRTREFWEPPSDVARLAAARVRAHWTRAQVYIEFPRMGDLGFTPEDLGFPLDVSWHNDTAASFETEDGLYRLWVAEANPADREYPEEKRFVLCRNNLDGTLSDDEPLFTGESVDDLKAFVEEANLKTLQDRGRSIAAPRG